MRHATIVPITKASKMKNPNRITKKDIKAYITKQLKTSDKWVKSALIRIYEFQTTEEQSAEETRIHNEVGFTGVDAKFCTSLAKQLIEKQFLTPPQLSSLKKMMPKYWQQIYNICDKDKLMDQVYKDKHEGQLDLFQD